MKEYIFALVLIMFHCANQEVIASSEFNNIRNHLGSRTPYRFKSNKNDCKMKYPGCMDTKIWMIIRHGTRLPSTEDIIAANSTLGDLKYKVLINHKQRKGKLNKEQLQKLEEWSSNINVDEEKYLTLEGQDEMVLMAERMHKRFPNAIKHKYNNKTFHFRYTATQRTQQSARHFVNGLFEKKDAQDVIFAPAVKVDPVLRFYKHCDKWQKQVKRNPEIYKEQKSYAISKEMNETLESVSKRLGFDNALTFDIVNIMYKMCGFETAWRKHHISPWCHAFDGQSIKALEYYHDLKNFWIDGYGHHLTYRQACVSIRHMFEHFSDDMSDPRAVFLFAHSGTLLKILTHLGLYKPDYPLTANVRHEDRPWRISDIDCFAANLAFVLFKCKDGDHVLALHQEHVIKLPMCETELCRLDHLTDYFKESIYNCNYSDMCKL